MYETLGSPAFSTLALPKSCEKRIGVRRARLASKGRKPHDERHDALVGIDENVVRLYVPTKRGKREQAGVRKERTSQRAHRCMMSME